MKGRPIEIDDDTLVQVEVYPAEDHGVAPVIEFFIIDPDDGTRVRLSQEDADAINRIQQTHYLSRIAAGFRVGS